MPPRQQARLKESTGVWLLYWFLIHRSSIHLLALRNWSCQEARGTYRQLSMSELESLDWLLAQQRRHGLPGPPRAESPQRPESAVPACYDSTPMQTHESSYSSNCLNLIEEQTNEDAHQEPPDLTWLLNLQRIREPVKLRSNYIQVDTLDDADAEITTEAEAPIVAKPHPVFRRAPNHASYRGRSSNDAVKKAIYEQQVMGSLDLLCRPCKDSCCKQGTCTMYVSVKALFDTRIAYLGDANKPAPTDKERAEIIINLLKQTKSSANGELIFIVGDGYEVCTTGFLRLLGVLSDTDETYIPGQWKRLIKGFKSGESSVNLLSEKDIRMDATERASNLEMHATTFILHVSSYYSDTLPAVLSETSSTRIRQVPYRTVADLWHEYLFHCAAFNIPLANQASYSTFLRAFRKMHNDEIVKLLGGKGGFQTCSVCNQCLNIKKTSIYQKDQLTLDAVRKIVRLHLQQQQTERQHAENVVHQCKTSYDARGNPTDGYVDIDGQTVTTGDTPKYQKLRGERQNNTIENRNIGVHIVCGPIDKWISVSTDNTIPGGANVLIEVTRMAIEILAELLAVLGFTLPKTLHVQYDNCGENKNKENSCFMSQLVEEMYFDKIEVFFLIVGHTHNLLDQWFSVLGKAVKGADFIGSPLALHQLYKRAHRQAGENDAHRPDVYQLRCYRDWRKYYDAVRNVNIHHYNLPHRTKYERDEFFGVCYYQYQFQSPPYGSMIGEVWQPTRRSLTSTILNDNGDVQLAPFCTFGGEDAVLGALGLDATANIKAVLNRDKKTRKTAEGVSAALPFLRELELSAIGAFQQIALREARDHEWEHPPQLADSFELSHEMLAVIDEEMIKDNSAEGGNIVWLQRSKCSDSEWLSKAPDVLPNPRKWRELLATTAKKQAYDGVVVVVSDDDDDEIIDKEIMDVISKSIDEPSPRSSNTANPREISKRRDNGNATLAEQDVTAGKSRRLSQHDEIKLARKRLMHFQRGAQEMASTATEILGRVRSNTLPVAAWATEVEQIPEATQGFSRAILTQVEVNFYESIKTARLITARAEQVALEEESKPWQLLNLPAVSQETRSKLRAIQDERMRQQRETEGNLRKILLRRGEGEYDPKQQVVSFDGFKPAEVKDIKDMTKDELIIIARGHIPNIHKMKKNILLDSIVDFMKNNPGVITLPTNEIPTPATVTHAATTLVASSSSAPSIGGSIIDTETSTTTLVPATTAPIPMTVTTSTADCAIMECNSVDVVFCQQCEQWFCSDMHGLHSSHAAQTHFKVGRAPVAVAVVSSEPSEPEPSEPEPHAMKLKAATSRVGEPQSMQKPDALDVQSTSTQAPPVVIADHQAVKLSSAITAVRQVLSRTYKTQDDRSDGLLRVLNYSTYDVPFLLQIAEAIPVDVSRLTNQPRLKREYLASEMAKLLSLSC